MSEPRRIVCWYSCGAASAVATKLAIGKNARRPEPLELVVVRCRVDEEHPDNDRFAAACAEWFGQPIIELASKLDGTSIYNVFRRKRFIVGVHGAPCTIELKRRPAERFRRPGDRDVYGFTAEEGARVERMLDRDNTIDLWAPALDAGLTHSDCVAMVERAGIELPTMYKLGYKHNNCIGCVKAGMGYWNKIRVDFPEAFDRMAKLERELGTCVVRGLDGALFLDQLAPDAGDVSREPSAQCGLFCDLAEREIRGE